jgi:hypothetical protein
MRPIKQNNTKLEAKGLLILPFDGDNMHVYPVKIKYWYFLYRMLEYK